MLSNSLEYIVKKEAELSKVAQYLAEQKHSKIICLTGDLGAGKTALVKAFCKLKKSTDSISSPTFSIVNEYVTEHDKIFHFDLYRLESIEEIIDIGIEEYLYSGDYCLIEWPEQIKDVLIDRYIDVKIALADGNTRKIVTSEIQ